MPGRIIRFIGNCRQAAMPGPRRPARPGQRAPGSVPGPWLGRLPGRRLVRFRVPRGRGFFLFGGKPRLLLRRFQACPFGPLEAIVRFSGHSFPLYRAGTPMHGHGRIVTLMRGFAKHHIGRGHRPHLLTETRNQRPARPEEPRPPVGFVASCSRLLAQGRPAPWGPDRRSGPPVPVAIPPGGVEFRPAYCPRSFLISSSLGM